MSPTTDCPEPTMLSAWIPSLRSRMTRRAEGPFFRLSSTAAKPPLSSTVYCLLRQSRPFRLSSFIACNRLGFYQSPCGSLQDDECLNALRLDPVTALLDDASGRRPILSSTAYRGKAASFVYRLSSTAYRGKAAPFVYRLSSIVFRLSSFVYHLN